MPIFEIFGEIVIKTARKTESPKKVSHMPFLISTKLRHKSERVKILMSLNLGFFGQFSETILPYRGLPQTGPEVLAIVSF